MTTAHHVPSWIQLAGAHNVRDLGGLPAGGGTVRPRVLLRGDNLDSLTTEDIALLRDDVGLRGVVDLRAPFENPKEAEWFPQLGVTWLHEPLMDFTGLSNQQAMRDRIGNDYTSFYGVMLEGSGAGLARILEFLVSGPRTPALVHCAAGKDRTGIVTSVLLAVAGVERDAIVADYLATEQRIQAVREALAQREEYRHLREQAASNQSTGATGSLGSLSLDPRAIIHVLDTVEAAPGGVAGFLIANGVTQEQIDRWREMIIEPS
ncbi:tyrosine-protein phosphatase [Pseudofrankia sp. BMG5.36]|uniref:tyrosine-protein phosphatase n=1 Tax=Pseudofrankia sp. BMG5.36 TaxID=1834512 RepID=UPI0008D91E15|nr:tyrosine-protein phosphatase [Pseudofrankia sp. BMG5.36]OHV47440.1 protein tyrosine phosphatase [Pseudofrankia sp. BMG5.36]